MYDLLARYYDILHASLTADLEYILDVAEITGGPVLELGCGTGRITIPLARAGHQVTGVDNSAKMLLQAQKRLHTEPQEIQQRVELLEADIRDFSFFDKRRLYPLALLPYNTVLHFRANVVRFLLHNVSAHLQQNGRVYIDLTNPFAMARWSNDQELVLEKVFFDSDADQTVRQFSQSRLDSSAQCLHTKWTFEVDADSESARSRTVVEFDYWYHFPHQLELFLDQSGLILENLAGDYDGSPFDEHSERLLMIARRRNPISN